jgi:hypothetical protein
VRFLCEYMQRVGSRAYNIIITSTELCLEDTHFSELLWTADFKKNVLSIIIDEAHCVSEIKHLSEYLIWRVNRVQVVTVKGRVSQV